MQITIVDYSGYTPEMYYVHASADEVRAALVDYQHKYPEGMLPVIVASGEMQLFADAIQEQPGSHIVSLHEFIKAVL